MANSGSITLTPSAKAWSGEVVWEISGSTLYLSLYMWKTDGTNKPSSAGYTSSGYVMLNGSKVIDFTYDQIEYGRTQYGRTYSTSYSSSKSYDISASITGLTGTAYSGTTLSGSGYIDSGGSGYTVYISSGNGVSVNVYGVSGSPIYNNSVVNNGDYIFLDYTVSDGYALKSLNVAGATYAGEYDYNGIKYKTYTVTGNVVITATAEPMGLVYIDNGTKLEAYQIFIDNGSKWEQYIPYIDNGSGWGMCN